MLEAAWWGFVGGAALIIGALLGVFLSVSNRVIGLIMAFGAGVLISAVAFELTQEAYTSGGTAPVVGGLVAGSLVFFAGDWFIDNAGGHRRNSPDGKRQQNAGPTALVLGALLDGIPESAAIGVSLLGGGRVGVPIVAAVFLSNVPEAMSASAGLRRGGRSTGSILRMWVVVAVFCTLAAAAGYGLLANAPAVVVATIQTFAAGAIITMLADTMLPEATEHSGRWAGLLTMAGFVLAFLLSAAQ